MQEKDYLWFHLRELPYFRALLRAVEARFYDDIHLPGPTLDIGCGDGHFAFAVFDHPIYAGLDPELQSLRTAQGYKSYRLLIQANGNNIPFPDEYFASAISNSVLEHIPQVEQVIEEVARVLKPGGLFVFCVPNHNFLDTLSIGQFLDRVNLHPLGEFYRSFFNRISRHYHCDPPEKWESRLELAGFQLEKWWHYFSPEALHVLEWGHYFGLPSLITQRLTGRWILASQPWNLSLTRAILQPYYDDEPICEEGVYSFYIARRIVHGLHGF